MWISGVAALALVGCLVALVSLTDASPRFIRSTADDPDYVNVTTKYGGLRGRTYNVSDSVNLDIFLGVPYAQPPIGDLRLARPEPIPAWSPEVRDAVEHGAKCVQRVITGDPVLTGVPFSEDCLFLDIYTTRRSDAPGSPQPVMVYIHPGGFYGGSGAKYNFTNLALKGVVVVSVSYRLDMFGFLSTEDDVIPGNFGLLDSAMALDFVKEIISDFGGNPDDITLFGASAGSAMVSIFTLSPLTRGKFHKAIMQSGGAMVPWAVFTPGRTVNVPTEVAHALGRRLNCSLPDTGSGGNTSRDLLTCLRATPVDTLVQESVALQNEVYRGDMVFIPVSGDSFGVLPETPEQLLAKTSELVPIPIIVGYTTEDGSWLVPDPDNDGITYPEFQFLVNYYAAQGFPPSERAAVLQRITETYMPKNPSALTPVQLRTILVRLATDFSQAAFLIKQARLFAKGGTGSGLLKPETFVYEFDYLPSYSTAPRWQGVGHADEKGFVLGLPPGPDPFNYPDTTAEDRHIAEMITTMWTDFAKYGDPTPQPMNWPVGLRWPTFGDTADDQKMLLIETEPRIKEFDRGAGVIALTGGSGLPNKPNSGRRTQTAIAGVLGPALCCIIVVWKLTR